MTDVIHNQQKKPAKIAGKKHWIIQGMNCGIT
jgi:hypothetical protein